MLVWVVLQVQSVDCSAHHTKDSIIIRDTIRDNTTRTKDTTIIRDITTQVEDTTTDTTVMAIDATVIGKKEVPLLSSPTLAHAPYATARSKLAGNADASEQCQDCAFTDLAGHTRGFL